ncbi:hypothetical protein HanIR_Chr17g0885651 [Helianthus annuus]|nr:hypothetical protein HanIR_Chr17g0885651 [Helianthus annuus]
MLNRNLNSRIRSELGRMLIPYGTKRTNLKYVGRPANLLTMMRTYDFLPKPIRTVFRIRLEFEFTFKKPDSHDRKTDSINTPS